MEYPIKWADHPHQFDMWVPASHLRADEVVQDSEVRRIHMDVHRQKASHRATTQPPVPEPGDIFQPENTPRRRLSNPARGNSSAAPAKRSEAPRRGRPIGPKAARPKHRAQLARRHSLAAVPEPGDIAQAEKVPRGRPSNLSHINADATPAKRPAAPRKCRPARPKAVKLVVG